MAIIGYYSMVEGQGVAQMQDDIIAAGHTPVAIMDLSSAELAGLDALYVWNGDNWGFNAEFTDRMGDISDAVSNGMNMVIFDRATGNVNPQLILPGTTLNHVRATTADANLTAAGEESLGQDGQITDASLDGGNFTTHGYVTADSLPPGATVLMTLGDDDESKAVGFVYDFGAGSVQYYGIPMDYYNETSQAWEDFAISTLEFATICLAEGTRVLTFRGYRPVEKLRAGQLVWTLDNGFQPVVAVIQSDAGPEDVYHLPKGVLANSRPLWVSAQHRIFLRAPVVELLSGSDGAFVVAKHLTGIGGVTHSFASNMRFFNLAFVRHEVILAEGALVESLLVNSATKWLMGRAARKAVAQCPEMELCYPELNASTARAAFSALCASPAVRPTPRGQIRRFSPLAV